MLHEATPEIAKRYDRKGKGVYINLFDVKLKKVRSGLGTPKYGKLAMFKKAIKAKGLYS